MKSQLGTTLIGLLVGLVISMLCIIAVLSVYRTMVKTGVDSRVASTHDTQLQSGFTTAQMFLQNAGFGLDGSSHFLQSDTISIDSKNVNAILWRFKEGSTVVCQGLADVATADNKKRSFILLNGFLGETETNCSETESLSSTTIKWKVKATLAELEDYSLDKSNPKQINFEQSTANCTPYGAGDPDVNTQHPLVTILAQTSTQQVAGLGQIKVPVCLMNIIA